MKIANDGTSVSLGSLPEKRTDRQTVSENGSATTFDSHDVRSTQQHNLPLRNRSRGLTFNVYETQLTASSCNVLGAVGATFKPRAGVRCVSNFRTTLFRKADSLPGRPTAATGPPSMTNTSPDTNYEYGNLPPNVEYSAELLDRLRQRWSLTP